MFYAIVPIIIQLPVKAEAPLKNAKTRETVYFSFVEKYFIKLRSTEEKGKKNEREYEKIRTLLHSEISSKTSSRRYRFISSLPAPPLISNDKSNNHSRLKQNHNPYIIGQPRFLMLLHDQEIVKLRKS